MSENEKEQLKKWIIRIIILLVVLVIGTLIINSLFFQHEEGLVCVTRTGECYHSPGCHYLRSVIEKGIEQAKSAGYSACSYCGGIPKGTIVVNNYLAAGCIMALLMIGVWLVWLFKFSNNNSTLEVDQDKNYPISSLRYSKIEQLSYSSEISKVEVGDIVTFIYTDTQEEKVVKLVNINQGNGNTEISINTPIGQALLGNCVGDKIKLKLPFDNYVYIEITKID